MVRLQLLKLNSQRGEFSRLNSTMVRLQQAQIRIKLKINDKSQFHYGSITTRKYGIKFKDKAGVSIPLWFDYNRKNCNCTFSFQIVSIPLWFDYNGSGSIRFAIDFRGLNSTMVRLQRCLSHL